MSASVEYKEFQSLQDFKRYLRKWGKDTYPFGNTVYYWDPRHIIRRRRVNKKNNDNFEPSDIKYHIDVGGINIIYFYIKDDGVCCLIVCGYRFELENKLYHLIHGPKALSIPDAFRVLSL